MCTFLNTELDTAKRRVGGGDTITNVILCLFLSILPSYLYQRVSRCASAPTLTFIQQKRRVGGGNMITNLILCLFLGIIVMFY